MRLRRVSRLIVLDDRNRVLLFQIEDATVSDPDHPGPPVFWVLPGGGLEAGEDHEAAARREVWEETGMSDIELGPWVWTSECYLDWGGELIQVHERYYLTRVERADVRLDHLDEGERAVYRGHRWWALNEVRASAETFFPRGLGDLLVPMVEGQIPVIPISID